MDKSGLLIENLKSSVELKNQLLEDEEINSSFSKAVSSIVNSYQNDGKVLFCGNGGSAADSQHLAAELSGRYYKDRPPLFAEALHVNTSYLTAVGNDYGYDYVYSRLLKAMGRKGDILIGLSTSGNSKNVLEALDVAKQAGMITIGMTGEGGGKMADKCDILFEIPSKDTPRIQECHMLIGHSLCQAVEEILFG